MLRMRNKKMEAKLMLSKWGIGIAMIGSALLLMLVLRWLTEGKSDDGSGDAKRFDMPHEFPEKSMIEKEVTEGMNGIPDTDLPASNSIENDSYFDSPESGKTSPPTDSF